MSDPSPATTPIPLEPDPDRRAAGMRELRAQGDVVAVPGIDGVMAAVTYEAVATGLSSVYSFGGSAGQDGVPDEDVTIAALLEPRHGKVRRIINSVVAFHKSQQIETFLDELTSDLIDQMLADARGAGAAGVDVVEHLAKPIPPAAMARLIGLPADDVPKILEWARGGAAQFQRAAAEGKPIVLADIQTDLRDYIDARIEERLALPTDDWPQDALTRFLTSDVEGERLTPRSIRTQIMFMMGAGTDTTRNTLGNLFYRLARDPQAYAALRSDPALVDVAIEETLRIDSPAQFLVRTCRAEQQVGDTLVEPEQRVFMCIGSANRDDKVFEDAQDYRLDRTTRDHLAFGTGPHICPGAALARLELRTTLRNFARRVGAFRLADGYEFDPLPTGMLHGPRALPIVIESEVA